MLLVSIPTGTPEAREVAALARARRLTTRTRCGYLHVYSAKMRTPGSRYAPRERADAEGCWRHIPRPEFAALNEDAERERDRVRNEGLARHHRERRAARELE